jgi:hypothetical protein
MPHTPRSQPHFISDILGGNELREVLDRECKNPNHRDDILSELFLSGNEIDINRRKGFHAELRKEIDCAFVDMLKPTDKKFMRNVIK